MLLVRDLQNQSMGFVVCPLFAQVERASPSCVRRQSVGDVTLRACGCVIMTRASCACDVGSSRPLQCPERRLELEADEREPDNTREANQPEKKRTRAEAGRARRSSFSSSTRLAGRGDRLNSGLGPAAPAHLLPRFEERADGHPPGSDPARLLSKESLPRFEERADGRPPGPDPARLRGPGQMPCRHRDSRQPYAEHSQGSVLFLSSRVSARVSVGSKRYSASAGAIVGVRVRVSLAPDQRDSCVAVASLLTNPLGM